MMIRFALLISVGLIGAASADPPSADRENPGPPANPYTLLATENAATGAQADQPREERSLCPYSLAPAEINGGGAVATSEDGQVYSIMSSVTWIGGNEQATSENDSYALDAGFWDAASGPLSCLTPTPALAQDDCNNNGIDDECEVAVRLALDQDGNCQPDECDDCNGNHIPDACDLNCLAFDGACNIVGCGCFDDRDNNGLPDVFVGGPNCNSLWEGCDPDCDGDGIPDTLDVPDVRFYVDASATERANNGHDWANAFVDLQTALEEAQLVDGMVEIWVAAGTYYPSTSTNAQCPMDDPRCARFQLLSCTALYGGFAGSEDALDQRDPVSNATVLSGDLDGDDDYVLCTEDSDCSGLGEFCEDNGYCFILGPNDDNSYHVVTATEGADPANGSAILDGFIITSGNANGTSTLRQLGGGLTLLSASPTVSNCVFESNQAVGNWGGAGGAVIQQQGGETSFTNCVFRKNFAKRGAGLYAATDSAISLRDCLFLNNLASQDGGGAYLESNQDDRHPSLTNCTFQDNHAGTAGGGIYNYFSDTELVNCVLVNNAADSGGGMENAVSDLTLHSCTIAGNHASAGGAGGMSSNPSSTLSVTNTILWGNTAGGSAGEEQQQISGGAIGISYSLIEGLSTFDLPFSGNFDVDPADPLLADLEGGNARLAFDSAAIDQGRYLSLPLDPIAAEYGVAEPLSFDADGNARVVGAEVDVGAYEYACASAMTLETYGTFHDCLSGPEGGLIGPACSCSDFDADQDVDLFDHALFQVMFVGPTAPAGRR